MRNDRDGIDGGRPRPSGASRESGEHRHVLSYLREKEGETASFVELVVHLAGEESSRGDASAVERIAVALYYVHLPRLEEAGVVEYDRRSRTVRYRGDGTVGRRSAACPGGDSPDEGRPASED